MALRKLYLHGALAEKYGAEHEVLASTIGEAVRIVGCNWPDFVQTVRRGRWHIAVGGEDLDEAMEMPEHHLFVPTSRSDWHLVPALEGGKGRTGKIIFSVIVGGALLATGVGGAVAGGALSAGGATTAAAFAASTGFLGLSYGAVALMGASILLGGLSMLLTPVPKTDTSDKKPTSFSFDGPGEVDDEGGPIHIICGEVVTGGIKIASAIESASSGSLSYSLLNGAGVGLGGRNFGDIIRMVAV